MTVPRAFFFLGHKPDGKFDGYPHTAVLLAEGLRDSGWTIASDMRAWQTEPEGEYLFPGGGAASAADADLIIVADDWFILGAKHLPKACAATKSPVVYIDRFDLGPWTRPTYEPELRRADLILKGHASRYLKYPSNVQPLVFGISERIQKAGAGESTAGRSGAMWNFRHKAFPHSVRKWAQREVRPILDSLIPVSDSIDAEDQAPAGGYEELMLRQTCGRHFDSYYRRMKETLVCACFGGWFLLPVRQGETGLVCRAGRGLLRRVDWTTPAIAQWDSWRMWEAFASGTTVLHFDFEQHRFLTGGPLPEPMKHYVAADLKNPRESLEAALADPEKLKQIGEAGRRWALENYNFVAMSQRLLRTLGLSARIQVKSPEQSAAH